MGECCHGRRNDRLCAECEDRPYEINAEIDRLTTERDAAQAAMVDGALREAELLARAERAEKVAVWAARNGAVDGGPMDEDAPHSLEWDYQGSTTGTCHDGTDAGIYRALVEACDGGVRDVD